MKTKLLLFVFSLLLFASCEGGSGKYTVWTGEMDYYTFQSQLGVNFDLYDGMYMRVEINKDQWENTIDPLLDDADNDRHRWSKTKIYDWLLGRGFGNEEARKESSWITTVNHGMILVRDNNDLHVLIK